MAIAAGLIALVVPILVIQPASGVPVTPRVIPLPAQLDSPQQYQGQSECDPVAKPGILKLAALLKATYGKDTMYTTRPCADDPTSEHIEGRALDWMVTSRDPNQQAKATAFLDWLLAPGADGTPAEMARRMGIMYIGWNNQIWRGYNPIGWAELKGCYSKPGTNYDTYCHRDHVHFSMTWDGAAALTSYWSDTPMVTPSCSAGSTSGKVPAVPGPLHQVVLPAVTPVFNSATGRGNKKQVCRLQQSRWSGDNQKLDVQIAGKAGVPTTGVKNVMVRVRAVNPNAPMQISVWPTNGKRPASGQLVAPMSRRSDLTLRVKLGAKGRISVATSTGDTAIRVDVVSYRAAS